MIKIVLPNKNSSLVKRAKISHNTTKKSCKNKPKTFPKIPFLERFSKISRESYIKSHQKNKKSIEKPNQNSNKTKI